MPSWHIILWVLVWTWSCFMMFSKVCSASLIILFFRGTGFPCLETRLLTSVSESATHGLCFSELLDCSHLNQVPWDVVCTMICPGCSLQSRYLWIRRATDAFLLEFCLYLSIWMYNSGSLRCFTLRGDSSDCLITRCCQIPTGSKLLFILAHFCRPSQQLSSMLGPALLQEGLLAQLLVLYLWLQLPSLPPSPYHPQCSPEWVSVLDLTRFRDKTEFCWYKRVKRKTCKYLMLHKVIYSCSVF